MSFLNNIDMICPNCKIGTNRINKKQKCNFSSRRCIERQLLADEFNEVDEENPCSLDGDRICLQGLKEITNLIHDSMDNNYFINWKEYKNI